jgi:pyrroloquinoline quinone (PQQ) biosynthesis protein C
MDAKGTLMESMTETRKDPVLERLDTEVDGFCSRARFFREDLTPGRAKLFVLQHRLNTRQRNSVLKLRVATNCPDWDTRIDILKACAQEVIADHEHGGGRPHWQVLEELGTRIGLRLEEIRSARPIASTELAWLAWDGLMSNRHWLEGIVANTCAERANVPGYGQGVLRERGWFGYERLRWGKLFHLPDDELEFFQLHEQADFEHSEMGWKAVARFARQLHMEEAVVEACRKNLLVWERYLEGIADAGDALDRAAARPHSPPVRGPSQED